MEQNNIQKIFGKNFIGAKELFSFLSFFLKSEKIIIPPEPAINYSEEMLTRAAKEGYILILGLPDIGGQELSINNFRKVFGVNPTKTAPSFYNQDWYLNENFIDKKLNFKWYLIKKEPLEDTRAELPDNILKERENFSFPSAILCCYTFFAYYFYNKERIWEYDFVWCSDLDHNGDRIYVGKYHDVDGINSDGFSIHRHLKLRTCYTAISAL